MVLATFCVVTNDDYVWSTYHPVPSRAQDMTWEGLAFDLIAAFALYLFCFFWSLCHIGKGVGLVLRRTIWTNDVLLDAKMIEACRTQWHVNARDYL